MHIRHLVALDNVAQGVVINPMEVRHGIIVGAKVADLGGLIDPSTHLNVRFPQHRVTQCLIVERCERGANILVSDTGFLFAWVDDKYYRDYGKVNEVQEREEWHKALKM